jgi:NAD(P)-dependent dehydrogenase (short-subunit alcohol dehydrogenase family)
MAVELAPRGITVNAVAPGPVDGPLARDTHPQSQIDDYLATIPQGRYAQAAEIASAVAFLAGPVRGTSRARACRRWRVSGRRRGRSDAQMSARAP